VPTRSEVLASVPLFALLDPAQLSQLAARVDEIREPKGTLLFRAGDPGDAMYVVLEGRVELFFTNNTGQRVLLEEAVSCDFFGEMSLFDSGPRTTSALVTEPLLALLIDHDDLKEFVFASPQAALDLMAAMGRRLRETTRLLRSAVSRNINEETEDKRTSVQRAADWIADFSGSLTFLFIHIVLFAVWIALNVAPLTDTSIGGWDPFPFGLLTMCVSLEAIILSVFVLLSQNRQVSRDRVRNDIEYEVNLKSELEITQLHHKVDQLYEQFGRRLANLERANGRESVLKEARDRDL
jgi:CRP/FNR family cyclic AMP-dependent transcriptional regulator